MRGWSELGLVDGGEGEGMDVARVVRRVRETRKVRVGRCIVRGLVECEEVGGVWWFLGGVDLVEGESSDSGREERKVAIRMTTKG